MANNPHQSGGTGGKHNRGGKSGGAGGSNKPGGPGKSNKSGNRSAFASQGASRGIRRPARQDKKAEIRTTGPVSPNRLRGFAGGERPYDYAYYESEPATPDYMARLFNQHDFQVDAAQLRKYWRLYELLREYNASLDLTRIMGIEATVLKHFIDSALILRHVELAGPVLDIGTGPGFPGLPLAIMRPKTRFLLAESRGKRVQFLEIAVRELKLGNVDLYPRSVREDSQLGHDYGIPIGDVVTRALETIKPTLDRIFPLVEKGAKAVFMKGPNADDEIREADAAYNGVFALTGDIQYVLPGTDQQRRLVVYTKMTP
ncbi:MAG: 16S rRNA (guanine(527)-N(7))-methyltransferase RsmG [Planctomycetes bacterium]|nr:16S rRNA (guanine(527)-N(7))-methyltransferase RsmG [Planctomycetota bacterium]